MKINISIPTKLGGKEAAKEIRNEIADPRSHFKWLPKEVEKRLGLRRTNFCIGDSFRRCCVVYETAIPGVFLTNYDHAGQLVDTHTWMAFGEKEGVRFTQEGLNQIPPSLFNSEFQTLAPYQHKLEGQQTPQIFAHSPL